MRRLYAAVLSQGEPRNAVWILIRIEFYNGIVRFLCHVLYTSAIVQMLKLHKLRWCSRPWREITAIAENHSTRPVKATIRWSILSTIPIISAHLYSVTIDRHNHVGSTYYKLHCVWYVGALHCVFDVPSARNPREYPAIVRAISIKMPKFDPPLYTKPLNTKICTRDIRHLSACKIWLESLHGELLYKYVKYNDFVRFSFPFLSLP